MKKFILMFTTLMATQMQGYTFELINTLESPVKLWVHKHSGCLTDKSKAPIVRTLGDKNSNTYKSTVGTSCSITKVTGQELNADGTVKRELVAYNPSPMYSGDAQIYVGPGVEGAPSIWRETGRPKAQASIRAN